MKALLQTFYFILSILVVSVGTTYLLSLLGPEAPAIAGCILVFGAIAYGSYGLILYRLQQQEILDKLNNK